MARPRLGFETVKPLKTKYHVRICGDGRQADYEIKAEDLDEAIDRALDMVRHRVQLGAECPGERTLYRVNEYGGETFVGRQTIEAGQE